MALSASNRHGPSFMPIFLISSVREAYVALETRAAKVRLKIKKNIITEKNARLLHDVGQNGTVTENTKMLLLILWGQTIYHVLPHMCVDQKENHLLVFERKVPRFGDQKYNKIQTQMSFQTAKKVQISSMS
jgi:hypothetical protein